MSNDFYSINVVRRKRIKESPYIVYTSLATCFLSWPLFPTLSPVTLSFFRTPIYQQSNPRYEFTLHRLHISSNMFLVMTSFSNAVTCHAVIFSDTYISAILVMSFPLYRSAPNGGCRSKLTYRRIVRTLIVPFRNTVAIITHTYHTHIYIYMYIYIYCIYNMLYIYHKPRTRKFLWTPITHFWAFLPHLHRAWLLQ